MKNIPKIRVTLQSALFLFVYITCAFPERVASSHHVNSFIVRICYAVDGVVDKAEYER